MQNQSPGWDLGTAQSKYQWELILYDPLRWPFAKNEVDVEGEGARTEDDVAE